MTTSRAFVPRLFARARHLGEARPAGRGARRRSARRAVGLGLFAFLLATLALAWAAETAKPQWRDPEYGHRLRRLRAWQKERPERPLVLFVGSSRVQMGVSPADMGFADAPGSPLVYNAGYRCATPAVAWLQLQRFLDDGIRPTAVVLMVAAVEVNLDGPAERQFAGRGARLSGADLRRLEPLTDDPTAFRRDRRAARLDPWNARREALASDVLPGWQAPAARLAHEGWEGMDGYGFTRLPVERVTADGRRGSWHDVSTVFAPAMNAPLPTRFADRVIRDLVARCGAEGIAVAVAWAPESPAYRALYTPRALANIADYSQTLTRELGVPVFAAPEHLEEDDFADGFHLARGGPAKYSRWLADVHLRPWRARR